MRRPVAIATLLSLVGSLVVGHQISNADPNFERLPACRKLEVIEASQKPLSRYIADSGFDQFAESIATTCPQYLVNLGEAWEIMLSDSKFSDVETFGRLSQCEQLNVIKASQKSVSEYIRLTGYPNFVRPVLEDCPGHLKELGFAWQNVYGGDPNPNPLAKTFDELPPCEKLRRVALDGKPIADYIQRSGIEEFESAIRQSCPTYENDLNQAIQTLNSETFETLPPCEQLRRIALDGKSIAAHIQRSGIEGFESAIRQSCPVYESELDSAIQNSLQNSPAFSLSSRSPQFSSPQSSNASNDAFEQLPPCQKLDVVRGTGKSVADYLAESGYEPFSADIYRLCQRHLGALEAAMARSE